jgi:hypothetical protein
LNPDTQIDASVTAQTIHVKNKNSHTNNVGIEVLFSIKELIEKYLNHCFL